ncbi:MAG: hypothetical protein WBO55_12530 [Rhizobiaceae bacterium]
MDTARKSMLGKLAGLFLAASLTAVSALSAAGQQLPEELEIWFEALRSADHEVFDQLLSEDATVDVRDLGIVQDREEFLESLDIWEDIASSTQIETKLVSSGDGKSVVSVCYRFAENDQLNRETFTVTDLLITSVVQEKIADDCSAF